MFVIRSSEGCGPAKHEKIGAKVVCPDNLFVVVSALQINRNPTEPSSQVIVDCCRTHREGQRAEPGELVSDFSHAGAANEITGKAETELSYRLRVNAELPHSIDCLISPRRVQWRDTPYECH